MDCTSCAPARPDRPHTFLAHEYVACDGCGDRHEARVVLRDGAVFHLLLCPKCGQRETRVHDDAEVYVREFVARALTFLEGSSTNPPPSGQAPMGPPPDTRDIRAPAYVWKQTTSTCPKCLALVEADVVMRGGRVYFAKDCRRCGPSEALVSEDAAYYARAYAFARAGTEPVEFRGTVDKGCPTDCGTCGDHEQHTCLPIIEITDHCNLECPVCIVDNQYSTHLSPATFAKMIDGLVAAEGQCESVALSGGEPTSHPQLLELIKIATRPEIGRIVVITNGLRLGRDRKFAQALKDSGVYIGLQLDGFSADVHERIRGKDLTEDKAAALAALRELDLPTQLIFVATRGVNEHQIGQAVELLVKEPHILSLNFQPMAFTGQGGGAFEHDPMDRLTIPGVIRAMDQQSGGRVNYQDFFPLPCSHPQCVSLTYLLRLNDGSCVPFARFVDFEKYTTLLRSSATLPATAEVEEALHELVHDVFANQDQIDRGPEILAALRRSLDEMFPPRPLSPQEAIRASERQSKSIFLHHYMDRHDFDLERLRKCCHHYPQPDGRIMPACGWNMFHRGAALPRGPVARPSPVGSGPDGSPTQDARQPAPKKLPVIA